MIHVLNLTYKDDLFATLRAMVEAGEPDAPVQVLYNGKHTSNVRSLYGGALLTCVEEPRVRMVPWTPHPKTTVGPRMQSLLDARAWWKAEEKVMRPKLTRPAVEAGR